MNGNMDLVTQEKQKEYQTMPLVVTNVEKSSSLPSTPDPLLRSFRMRSLTPTFPKQKRKPSWNSEIAWKKCSGALQILPDDDENEIPWHEEQPEELK